MNRPTVEYRPPLVHRDHIEPRGRLLDEPPYHALWYFMRCAHQAWKRVPEQITYDDEQQAWSNLMQIVQSCCMIYEVTKEELFDSEVIRRVRAEALRVNLPIKWEIDAFVNSGGKEYAVYHRDPDSFGREEVDDMDEETEEALDQIFPDRDD